MMVHMFQSKQYLRYMMIDHDSSIRLGIETYLILHLMYFKVKRS